MLSEKRIVEGYEITQTFEIGKAEIVLGEKPNAPDNMNYLTAMPQMRKYMKVSAEIYSVYLNYISPDDIYVYSIDECFIDVTDYCRLYKKLREKLPLCL